MKYLVIIIFIALLSSCYYDKEQELYGTIPCDTVNVRFSVQIKNTLQANCLRCHGGTAINGGGIQLGSYDAVKLAADNGRLLNAITRSVNTMPKGAGRLSDCRIAEIRQWISKGAPNN